MSHTPMPASAAHTPHYDYKYIKSFVCGGLAGMASKSLIAPLDRIKILFQTSTRKFTYVDGFREAVNVYKIEGVQGLWKGNVATLIRVFPYAATQFAAFDFFQSIFSSYSQTSFQRNVLNFIAGSLAGICATSITYPTEFIRTRMAMDKEKVIHHKTLARSVSNIYKREGFLAFYHGVIPSLSGIILYHGTGFFMYHYLKDKLREHYPTWNQSKLPDFAFGAIGGCIAQFISYPFDVIRKKMQAQNVLLQRGEISSTMRMTQWWKHILRTEGTQGLYKGFTMHFFKAPLANGTCFAVKNFLNRKMDAKYLH